MTQPTGVGTPITGAAFKALGWLGIIRQCKGILNHRLKTRILHCGFLSTPGFRQLQSHLTAWQTIEQPAFQGFVSILSMHHENLPELRHSCGPCLPHTQLTIALWSVSHLSTDIPLKLSLAQPTERAAKLPWSFCCGKKKSGIDDPCINQPPRERV